MNGALVTFIPGRHDQSRAVQSTNVSLSFCLSHHVYMRAPGSENLLTAWGPRQNDRHFADDILKGILFNENICILINISLKVVPNDPINIIPALVQIMAWRRLGDKTLSESMVVSLQTHIHVTRPQCVNSQVHVQIDPRYSRRKYKLSWYNVFQYFNRVNNHCYSI